QIVSSSQRAARHRVLPVFRRPPWPGLREPPSWPSADTVLELVAPDYAPARLSRGDRTWVAVFARWPKAPQRHRWPAMLRVRPSAANSRPAIRLLELPRN